MNSFSIICQNDDFIVINKPHGYSFHDEDGELGLFNQLAYQLKMKIWPVHRLDRLTSGLLIVATNQAAAVQLGNLFAKRQIEKSYLALSSKKPSKKQGKISGDMKKSRSGNWMLRKTKQNPAITRFLSKSLVPGIRLFLVKPESGKTHQIRVALKSLGSPILGDIRYGGEESDRAYLHAYQLSFTWHNQRIELTCFPTDGKYFNSNRLNSLLESF
jgi:tRNA pseudouridine32 synthase/23S rRNA pseudouridine746 synthase